MIKVKVSKDADNITGINVTGHANFANTGKDLVCAAVSSIVIGGLNGIDQYHRADTILNVYDNEINIDVVGASKQLQLLLNFLLIQLRTVEAEHSEYMKIINTEV